MRCQIKKLSNELVRMRVRVNPPLHKQENSYAKRFITCVKENMEPDRLNKRSRLDYQRRVGLG
jgi:hypothetical protein